MLQLVLYVLLIVQPRVRFAEPVALKIILCIPSVSPVTRTHPRRWDTNRDIWVWVEREGEKEKKLTDIPHHRTSNADGPPTPHSPSRDTYSLPGLCTGTRHYCLYPRVLHMGTNDLRRKTPTCVCPKRNRTAYSLAHCWRDGKIRNHWIRRGLAW